MSLDVVISWDVTGSMASCLHEVRYKLDNFISTLFKQVPDLKIGFIAHSDYCDENRPFVTKQLMLTDNISDLHSFIRNTPAGSGGDEDECYELVLEQVQTFNWQSENKIFILIGDCSAHLPGYKYGRFTVTKHWQQSAGQLAEQGIKTYAVQCLNRTYNDHFYNTLAQINGTPKLSLNQFNNITQLLTAITYKQQSNEQLQQYGEQLQSTGQLNRNLATIFNLLLEKDNLIGGIDFSEKKADLESVPAGRFQVLHVTDNISIKDFFILSGATFKIGKGFYELSKSEEVQERKEVILVNRYGDFFSGAKARELIGLPYGTRGKVRPKRGFEYKVFVQSTSNNRKLIGGTQFLYEVI